MTLPARGAYSALLLSLAVQVAYAEDEDWPLSSRLLDSFSEGNTARIITYAPAVLKEEPNNHELRLALANSLSWSGDSLKALVQYKALLGTEYDAPARLGLANALAWSGQASQAISYYQSLQGTKFGQDSRLGLANALRWAGHPDLALPHYEAAQEQESTREAAKQGMELSLRELRTRSWIASSTENDNSPFKRSDWRMGHRWRSSEAATIFSLEHSTASDAGTSDDRQTREWMGRVELTNWLLKPLFTFVQTTTPHSANLVHARLQFGDGPNYLNFGQVNWGKQSLNIAALDQGLTARQMGIDSNWLPHLGEVHTVVNRFEISDGNNIHNGEVTFTPAWRPFGPNLRTNIGATWRYADRMAESYWSPTKYAVAYIGLEGQWKFGDGSVSSYISGGTPVGGDAAHFRSAGASLQRWLNRNWILSGNAGLQSSTRGSRYESRSLGLRLERLW